MVFSIDELKRIFCNMSKLDSNGYRSRQWRLCNEWDVAVEPTGAVKQVSVRWFDW